MLLELYVRVDYAELLDRVLNEVLGTENAEDVDRGLDGEFVIHSQVLVHFQHQPVKEPQVERLGEAFHVSSASTGRSFFTTLSPPCPVAGVVARQEGRGGAGRREPALGRGALAVGPQGRQGVRIHTNQSGGVDAKRAKALP